MVLIDPSSNDIVSFKTELRQVFCNGALDADKKSNLQLCKRKNYIFFKYCSYSYLKLSISKRVP